MSVFVVDASLVIKWFVPEIHSEAARRWLDTSHDYVAPDLLFSETGNTVWKKVRRKELEETEGQQLVRDLAQIAVETVATRSLLEDAFALALTAGITPRGNDRPSCRRQARELVLLHVFVVKSAGVSLDIFTSSRVQQNPNHDGLLLDRHVRDICTLTLLVGHSRRSALYQLTT